MARSHVSLALGALTAIASCLWSPSVALGQTQIVMQPSNPWTIGASVGPAIDGADGAHGGLHLNVLVERALKNAWSVRIQNRTLWMRYDPVVNPAPVTSSTQLEFGVAMMKVVKPSPLGHFYAGGGASFLLTTFDGVDAPRNKALGVQGIVGLSIHPQSRRWNIFAEFYMQGRQMPEELANGRVFVAQGGISFGATVPLLWWR